MNYIKNIIIGGFIGCVLGLFIGAIFESKSMKHSKWKEQQKTKQIIFSVIGGVGGIVIGFKIAEEDE